MRHPAWLNITCGVLFSASMALLMAVAGCATPKSARMPSPDAPAVIYAIPQSQAFAIAHKSILSAAQRCGADSVHVDEISRGGGQRGYEADYRGLTFPSRLTRRLYVIPASGITESGQQVDGFRFQITYDLYENREAPVPQGCERALFRTLLTTLDATGTATTVTGLRLRPYGEGRAGP
jgi:hypothetical protein